MIFSKHYRGNAKKFVAMLLFAMTPAAGHAASANFVGFDTTTQGSWIGVYGADGHDIPNFTYSQPSYSGPSVLRGPSKYTWSGDTGSNLAGVQLPAPSNKRAASMYYNANSFIYELQNEDENSHLVALYLEDWDGNNTRAETVQVIDPSTGYVLDTRSVSAFTRGEYLVYKVTGHIQFHFTNNDTTSNAILNAVFFGGKEPGQ